MSTPETQQEEDILAKRDREREAILARKAAEEQAERDRVAAEAKKATQREQEGAARLKRIQEEKAKQLEAQKKADHEKQMRAASIKAERAAAEEAAVQAKLEQREQARQKRLTEQEEKKAAEAAKKAKADEERRKRHEKAKQELDIPFSRGSGKGKKKKGHSIYSPRKIAWQEKIKKSRLQHDAAWSPNGYKPKYLNTFNSYPVTDPYAEMAKKKKSLAARARTRSSSADTTEQLPPVRVSKLVKHDPTPSITKTNLHLRPTTAGVKKFRASRAGEHIGAPRAPWGYGGAFNPPFASTTSNNARQVYRRMNRAQSARNVRIQPRAPAPFACGGAYW